MNKKSKLLLLSSILTAGISTASANVISSDLASDFEGGLLDGWTGGEASKDKGLLPGLMGEGDNTYLQVRALANDNGKKSGANRRIAFFNQSENWVGDYSNITAIKGDFKATSADKDALFMRLNFVGADEKKYSSKNAFQLDTDGSWQTFTFGLDADSFFVQGDEDELGEDGADFQSVSAAQFALAILDIEELKFVSNEDYPQWSGVDVVRADLGVDNLAVVSNVSNVPLPGAAWLMISGLLGLGGITSKKRSKA